MSPNPLGFMTKREPQKIETKPEINEVKEEIKNEPKQEISEKIEMEENKSDRKDFNERQNLVIHSELDAFLMDRSKSQPKTLEEIESEIIVQKKEGIHALTLPKELDIYKNRFVFCWIFKRKQAIDEACDLYYYKLVNQTYFPELPNHLFTVRGTMERGDNILLFRSKKVDDEMRKVPGIESNERIKQRKTAHEGDPNFYIPKPEGDERSVVGV